MLVNFASDYTLSHTKDGIIEVEITTGPNK